MREHEGSKRLVHVVVFPPTVGGATVGELDAVVEDVGARRLVVDLSRTISVDDEAVLLLAWFAQRLENAGGKVSVSARRGPEGSRVTRTLRAGDLTCVLGVNAAFDKAVLRRLTAGAGGAAL